MLTEVKNQVRASFLSIKYALSREMLNRASFITNVVFMMLNNASWIVQWVILFSIKKNIGGYGLKQILLLWGIASGTYGVSRLFFKKTFSLSQTINQGKLDAYIVQPKNVLLAVSTTDVEPSALGDTLYAYIMLFIVKRSIVSFLLFTLLIICGGLIVTSIAVISGSLSFWLKRSESIAERMNTLPLSFATYPDGIFKGVTKIILYTLIPVGFANYLPLKVMVSFNPLFFLSVILYTVFSVSLAFYVFNRGLRRYSSTNLMSARI